MTTAYLVTEMDRLDRTGSALTHALLEGDYVEKVKEYLKTNHADFDWQFVTMNELFETLGEKDTQALIMLTKNTLPYKKALKDRYPSAQIGDVAHF